MACTRLDPLTALIAVDLQKGIVSHPGIHPMDDIVGNTAKLARAFRRCSLPVVLVHVAGLPPGRTEQALAGGTRPPDWTELVAELDRQPGDHVVEKRSWGAFANTGLDAWLRERGVTQVVVSGLITSIGVESTARQAYELGFNVTIALDATTDRSAGVYRNSLEHVFPKLGEVGTTREIIDLLEARGGGRAS